MPQVALIGSGIVGLTTALEIQSNGHEVTIYADSLPGDDKSTRYTSPWAGAHHVSIMGDDPTKREYERQTFEHMWAESAEGSEEARCFIRVAQRDYYEDDRVGKTQLEHMPNFRMLTAKELIPPAACGVAFTTVTIDTATYLPLLLARFLARGGRIRRAYVQHIDQVLLGAWGTPVPDALVVCPGIGARTLGGVEDKDVYPIRGQTVLVRAPWLQLSKTLLYKNGEVTYVIPRRSGDVVLGGTYLPNDWYPHPRLETGREILARALVLMPELVPPHLRDASEPPSVADIEPLVIEHGCGLRPARKGGIRLEKGKVKVEDPKHAREVPVVYNYGHAGAGYQASWGTASAAAKLLEESLKL
ncbi:D-aspartate oxidase [Ramaria rubella]|nr:D-aspartate oxidase [Ramaria rubella]